LIMYGASSVGKVRADNQDSYVLDTLDNGICYAIVCDGMGGAKGGKTASLTAVNELSGAMEKLSPDMSDNALQSVLLTAIDSVNNSIYTKSTSDKELEGMGTTLVAAVLVGDKMLVLNIGDSRCYIIRDDSAIRVTKDHSAVQLLVDSGLLTPSQARNHPNKNIITRALGVEQSVECDISVLQIKAGDKILLCTDGITNYIDDLELPFEMMKSIETIPQRLIELANSRGGADNSTVVVINI